MKENKNKYFILDFDSTFVKMEALDILAELSLTKDKDRMKKIEQVKSLTKQAMDGKISFSRSLSGRMKLIKANSRILEKLISRLRRNISRSIYSNRKFFKTYADRIIIVSGGFKEYIIPVVEKFGIRKENVYANEFVFDRKGNITGFNKKNLLAKDKGKSAQIAKLKLKGELIVIGDGATDLELKESGIAHKFYAFTENIGREAVYMKADHVAPSFDEFLYISKLPMTISYPKSRIKVLLLENIHNEAIKRFKEEGYDVECINRGIGEKELSEIISDVSILGIRSKTKVTKKVLADANRLHAIGAFCIGTDQIDLSACSNRGVIVFNAPFSNTRSVVELVCGEIIILMRGIFEKSAKLHSGIWDKTSRGSFEVRGKKLGIIGYGKIGSQLSVMAESLGMEVYYYDVLEKLALGNAKKCNSMNELLRKSDIVSVHIDGSPQNANLIGDKQFNLMKEGAVFLNLSRGHVVNIKSLTNALRSKKIRGAAIDVFPKEPGSTDGVFRSELTKFSNVILTPHIGGSTDEAQKNIASFVPSRIIDFINSGSSLYSVNFPELQLPALANAHRLIHIHHNVPGILADINNVFACHNININGQYLKTNDTTGYVITDISRKYSAALINELREIPYTIKFRILY